ncbi:MAG: hypothetical protein HYT87_02140 [Nitrospirae bacterium]|nr:hypothetical protein [Nitrospirota bacterium]
MAAVREVNEVEQFKFRFPKEKKVTRRRAEELRKLYLVKGPQQRFPGLSPVETLKRLSGLFELGGDAVQDTLNYEENP